MYSSPLFDAFCSGFDMHSSLTPVEQMAGTLGPHNSDRCEAKARSSSAAHTALASSSVLDQRLSLHGSPTAPSRGLTHLPTAQLGTSRPLVSIPGAAFTSASSGGMGAAGMTSLYGKLRAAAVSNQPDPAGIDTAGPAGQQVAAGPKAQVVCSASFRGGDSLHQNDAAAAVGNGAVSFSSQLPAGRAITCKSLPMQCGMFSNSYASSYSASRTSSLSSRSTTTSSLHAADQGHSRNVVPAAAPAKEPADTAGDTATGQQLFPTMGLSEAAQAERVRDEEALLSLLLAAHGPGAAGGTVALAAEPSAPGAGPTAVQPLIAHDIPDHASAVDQLQRLLAQHPVLDGPPSMLASATLHTVSPGLQQQFLMQQLAALQHTQYTITPITNPNSPLDAFAMLDAAPIANSHSTAIPEPLFSLQALLAASQCQSGAAPVPPAHVRGLASDQVLHIGQAAASNQLQGFAGIAGTSSASSAAHPSAAHLATGPSSPSEHLAQLLSQLGYGTDLASTSTLGNTTTSSHSTFAGATGMAGLGVAEGQTSSVSAALAALQHKLVMGSLEGGSGVGIFTTSTTALGPGPGMPASSKQAAGQLGPGSNPLYKTELCHTWLETGGCRYGARCQFAHGKHELRSIIRHPKYKTQPCRTFALQGSCPYGNRCNFIHDQHLQLPGGLPLVDQGGDGANSAGSSSSDGASAVGSCAYHTMEPAAGQL